MSMTMRNLEWVGVLLLAGCGGEISNAPQGVHTTRVEIYPVTAVLAPGQKQQFSALAYETDGTWEALPNFELLEYSVTGGTITMDTTLNTGNFATYTAGSIPGSYHVIAKEYGSHPLADTAVVTITSP